MSNALAGAMQKAARPRSNSAGTEVWERIMILAAMMSVEALTWGFGLERALGIEPS